MLSSPRTLSKEILTQVVVLLLELLHGIQREAAAAELVGIV